MLRLCVLVRSAKDLGLPLLASANRVVASAPTSTHDTSCSAISCSHNDPAPTWARRHGTLATRSYTEDLRVIHAPLSEDEYHEEADKTLDLLHDKLEAYVEDLDFDGGDVEYSQGVLTVKLGKLGTYVINKQTPNRQIWMSSPVSGPSRFDPQGGRWVYHRTGQDMLHTLETELKALTAQGITFS